MMIGLDDVRLGRAGPAPLVRRRAFSLVEVLIAATIAVMLLLALVLVLRSEGQYVRQGRALIELTGQLRGATHRLREDLEGATAPTRPWPNTISAVGYFEYVEGTGRDSGPAAADTRIGDRDDAIMFTARSKDRPFVGRVAGTLSRVAGGLKLDYTPGSNNFTIIESHVAEIVWWTATRADGTVSLHRRALLVRPDIDLTDVEIGALTITEFHNLNDLSARVAGGNKEANSIEDLTWRQNRAGHQAAFPHAVDANLLPRHFGLYDGDDILVRKVLAFDARLWDPEAPTRTDGNAALAPGDPGWAGASSNLGQGAFVDLGYTGGASRFSGAPHAKSQLPGAPTTYCTWCMDYEFDGINQDGDMLSDEGADGVDNDGNFGVDDINERETSPPYPHALRGIQVRVRVHDENTHQVRQAAVVVDFTPE